MNDQEPTQEPNALLRDAESWYVRVEDLNLSDRDWLDFLQWQSLPANQEAFDAVAARKECMFHAQLALAEDAALRAKVVSQRWAAAFVICVSVVGALFLLNRDSSPQAQIFATGDTAAGWQLEDGSLLRAGPNTRVEITFGDKSRSTRLVHGNAFFRVARIANRPFIVRTSIADVEARGTAFGISTTDRDAEVTVMEGTVAVTPRSAEGAPRIDAHAPFNLQAREQVRVSQTNIERAESADVMQSLAWAMNIQFADQPSIDAVIEFTQRSGIKVELNTASPTRTAPVSGIFQLDDPTAFAQYVANKTWTTVYVHRSGMPPTAVKPQKLRR